MQCWCNEAQICFSSTGRGNGFGQNTLNKPKLGKNVKRETFVQVSHLLLEMSQPKSILLINLL